MLVAVLGAVPREEDCERCLEFAETDPPPFTTYGSTMSQTCVVFAGLATAHAVVVMRCIPARAASS